MELDVQQHDTLGDSSSDFPSNIFAVSSDDLSSIYWERKEKIGRG
jgi:hypothetical protein